jgi:hypothetical protein
MINPMRPRRLTLAELFLFQWGSSRNCDLALEKNAQEPRRSTSRATTLTTYDKSLIGGKITIMRTVLFPQALVLAVSVCCATAALAAEPAADVSSAYKLSIDKPGDFRLAGKVSEVPAPESKPKAAPPVSAKLIDKPFSELIQHAAHDAALDPALVHAVIAVESGYNSVARSPKGALGLMQLMPETAARYGVREREATRSPAANLRAGTLYLSDLLLLFDGRLDLALAAYNAGENAVFRYGQRIPPYRETQLYVPAVLARYRELQEPLATVTAAAVVTSPPARIQYMQGTQLRRNGDEDKGESLIVNRE